MLQKSIPSNDESIAVLATGGVYPLFDSNFLRSVELEDGTTRNTRIYEYKRATDDLVVIGGRPQLDGEDIPMMGIITHQYKGNRSFSDFLRLMLAPGLALFSVPFALFLALAAAGYYGARAVDQRFSTREKTSRSFTPGGHLAVGLRCRW